MNNKRCCVLIVCHDQLEKNILRSAMCEVIHPRKYRSNTDRIIYENQEFLFVSRTRMPQTVMGKHCNIMIVINPERKALSMNEKSVLYPLCGIDNIYNRSSGDWLKNLDHFLVQYNKMYGKPIKMIVPQELFEL